jgi:hypothetical protein
VIKGGLSLFMPSMIFVDFAMAVIGGKQNPGRCAAEFIPVKIPSRISLLLSLHHAIKNIPKDGCRHYRSSFQNVQRRIKYEQTYNENETHQENTQKKRKNSPPYETHKKMCQQTLLIFNISTQQELHDAPPFSLQQRH